jgi:hypothetical protein
MRRTVLLLFLIVVLSVAVSLNLLAQGKAEELDKAYLQSIWDGWASGNAENQTKFYAQGPGHLYFDIAPLKYNSWEEYKAGVVPVLKQFSSMKFALNDDLQIHPVSKTTEWVDGTVNLDATTAAGENQKMILRWTAILEKQGDRWLIVHEHVSAPLK